MRLLIASPLARFYLRFAALLSNLVGAALIFFAFSFPSSVINLFTVPPGTVFTLINTNHLKLAWLGLILIVTSSFLSILSMMCPRSTNHAQEEAQTTK